MIQASKVLGDRHTHNYTHTLLHGCLVPADYRWNATMALFCPEAKEDTSLVHLWQNQFRPVRKRGRKEKDGQALLSCPALFWLSSSSCPPIFQALVEETEREPLTWGYRTMYKWEERSEGAWEQSERPVELVVNGGGKSVRLLSVLFSWWDNMSLTPL